MSSPIARLGAFDLLEPIGEGGMGAVYRAVHVREGVEVAVKVVSSAYLREPRAVAAFRREVRAVATLTHGNIISVLDHDVIPPDLVTDDARLSPGSPYLVMELGEATLRERTPTPHWTSVRTVLLQLLDALGHAHAHGIVHRDLKPPNILWVRSGEARVPRVKLSDFGLAHALATDADYGRAAGTPAYMAPEQFRAAARDYGPWTDLYAVGVIAYWLVAGRRPFEERDELALAQRHLHDPPPPLVPRFAVPSGLESWILRLLEKNPLARFRFAADAAYGLERMSGTSTPPPESATSSYVTTRAELLGEKSAPFLAEGAVMDVLRDDPDGSRTGPTVDGRLASREGHVNEEAQSTSGVALGKSESRDLLSFEFDPHGHPPPPLPLTWRRSAEVFPRHLLGAGLGLFGLRAIPLVGRAQERDRMWRALASVGERRRPEAVLLTGSAGIGKTALAEWFERRAHEVGAAHAVSAVHERGARGRRTLVEMVRAHLGVRGLDWAGTSQRVRQYMTAHGVLDDQERRSLTDLVAPSGAADSRGLRLVPVVTEHAVIARVLERACRDRPLLVRLEDAQWSVETITFVERMLDESRLPLIFVLTVQDEALADEPHAAARITALARRLDVTNLPLGPLHPIDHATLVRSLLHLGPQLAENVAARTAGNPLFAREVVRDWVERGMLRLTDDGFELAEGITAEVPDDLHAVFRDHVRRVVTPNSDELAALELAAVAGVRVDPTEWRVACDLAHLSIARGFLDRMILHRVLTQADTRGLDLALRFVHGLLRESLERSAREENRVELWHRAIAEMLEPRFETGEVEVAERLAQHQRAAGRLRQSLEPLRAAASLYTARAEYERALEVLDDHAAAVCALEGAEQKIEEVENRLGEAEVRAATGEFERASELLARALVDSRELGREDLVARSMSLAGYVASLRSDHPKAEALLTEALQRFDRLDRGADAARCLRGLAEIAASEGRLDVAFHAHLAALEHCRARADELGVAASLIGMGICDPHEPDGNPVPVLEALETCERAGLFFGVVASLNSLGEIARRSGSYSEAESRFKRALELATNLGAGHQRSIAATSLALVLFEANRVRDAREQLTRAIGSIEDLGHGQLALLAHAIAIAVHATLGSARSLRHHVWAARTWVERGTRGDAETVALLERTRATPGLDALDARDIARLAIEATLGPGSPTQRARSFFLRG